MSTDSRYLSTPIAQNASDTGWNDAPVSHREKSADERVQPPPSTRSPFARWDSVSWLRSKPFREGPIDALPFSPSLVPLASHPSVARDGRRRLQTLAYRLLAHLSFTTLLELDHIAPVCSDLGQGRSPIALTDEQRHDAMRILCDEGAHALFVDTFGVQVERTFELDRAVVGHPQFDSLIRAVSASAPSLPEALLKLFFVAISETLVTKVLFGIPRDEGVAPIVRAVLSDHGADEAAHASYFRALFGPMWRAVSRGQREELGRVLPRLVWAFLCPDRNLEARILRSFGYDAAEAQEILDEVYPPYEVAESVREAARSTLSMFDDAGVFALSSVREAFYEYELFEEPMSAPARSGVQLIWDHVPDEDAGANAG